MCSRYIARTHIAKRHESMICECEKTLNCYLFDLILESTDCEIGFFFFAIFFSVQRHLWCAYFGRAICEKDQQYRKAGCCASKSLCRFWNMKTKTTRGMCMCPMRAPTGIDRKMLYMRCTGIQWRWVGKSSMFVVSSMTSLYIIYARVKTFRMRRKLIWYYFLLLMLLMLPLCRCVTTGYERTRFPLRIVR